MSVIRPPWWRFLWPRTDRIFVSRALESSDAHVSTEDAIRRASVPSPGGWEAPVGTRPGWSWVPVRYGARPAPEPVPWWVRVWSRVPLIDRFADEWMWFHGGFLVVPPDHPLFSTYGPDEYEALTGMRQAEYERQLVEFARESFREDLTAGLIVESVGIEDARLVVLFRFVRCSGASVRLERDGLAVEPPRRLRGNAGVG